MSLSLGGGVAAHLPIGIPLIYVFAVELKLLPAFGRGGWWTWDGGPPSLTTSGLKSLVMPAITLGLYQLTLIMRPCAPRCSRCCAPTTSFARRAGTDRTVHFATRRATPCCR